MRYRGPSEVVGRTKEGSGIRDHSASFYLSWLKLPEAPPDREFRDSSIVGSNARHVRASFHETTRPPEGELMSKTAHRSLFAGAVITALSAALIAIPSPAEAHMSIHCKPENGRREADPIVTNDAPVPSAHLHTFLGNTVLDEMANPNRAVYSDLAGKATSCTNVADSAAYWFPTVYRSGVPLPIAGQTNYYRDWDNDQEDVTSPVVAFPPDARLVAGNANALNPQLEYITSWFCGEKSSRDGSYADPVAAACNKATGTNIQLTSRIHFPSCWDGLSNSHITGNTADFSGTHAVKQHYAYPLNSSGQPVSGNTAVRCPAGFGLKVPKLVMTQRFGYQGSGRDISISSGDIHSVHADFWNTWVQSGFKRAVDNCITTTIKDHPHGFAGDCGPDPNGGRV